MKRILFALETGTPMVQSPILGIWCCEGDLLDANRICVAKAIPVKIPVFRRRESPLRGPADLRRSKFRETSLFLKKFSLSRVAFEKM